MPSALPGFFAGFWWEAGGAARRPFKAPAAHEPVIPACSDWVIAVAGMAVVGRPLDARWVFRPERFGALAGIAAGEAVTPEAVAAVLLHPDGSMKGCPPEAVCAALTRAICEPVDRILIGSTAENGTVSPAEGC